MNEIMKPSEAMMTQEQAQAALMQCMEPMAKAYAAMTSAMNQMAAGISAMQQTMDRMQKENAYRIPLTDAQNRFLTAAIKERAQGIVQRKGLPQKAAQDAAREIRKKLQVRWGVNTIRQIPSFEYQAAMETVKYWDETDLVMRYM